MSNSANTRVVRDFARCTDARRPIRESQNFRGAHRLTLTLRVARESFINHRNPLQHDRDPEHSMHDETDLTVMRMETILFELESKFLYLLNDMYVEYERETRPLGMPARELAILRDSLLSVLQAIESGRLMRAVRPDCLPNSA